VKSQPNVVTTITHTPLVDYPPAVLELQIPDAEIVVKHGGIAILAFPGHHEGLFWGPREQVVLDLAAKHDPERLCFWFDALSEATPLERREALDRLFMELIEGMGVPTALCPLCGS